LIESETEAMPIPVIILRISDRADQPMNIRIFSALAATGATKPRNAADDAPIKAGKCILKNWCPQGLLSHSKVKAVN